MRLILRDPTHMHHWMLELRVQEQIYKARPEFTAQEVDLFERFSLAVQKREKLFVGSYSPMFHQLPLDIDKENGRFFAESAFEQWEYLSVDDDDNRILDHAAAVAKDLGLTLEFEVPVKTVA